MRLLVVVGEPGVGRLHVARVFQQLCDIAFEFCQKAAGEREIAPEVDGRHLGLVPLAVPRDLLRDGTPLQAPRA